MFKRITSLVAFALLFVCPLGAYSQSHQFFASPDDAVETLKKAVDSKDKSAVAKIFGENSLSIVSSGDEQWDRNQFDKFAAAFGESHRIAEVQGKKILEVGKKDWRFPIPLMERDGKWFFDVEAGKEEILNRRIGENEMNVAKFCLAYVDAQKEYAQEDRDGDGALEYAKYLQSHADRKDGLYWPQKEGEKKSPLGPLAANAGADSETKIPQKPFHGYFLKILAQQGPAAPGGAKSYVTWGGAMKEGFALLAYPSRWGVTGVKSFIVSDAGTVYEKDLGPNGVSVAGTIKSFNPDKSWTKVKF